MRERFYRAGPAHDANTSSSNFSFLLPSSLPFLFSRGSEFPRPFFSAGIPSLRPCFVQRKTPHLPIAGSGWLALENLTRDYAASVRTLTISVERM